MMTPAEKAKFLRREADDLEADHHWKGAFWDKEAVEKCLEFLRNRADEIEANYLPDEEYDGMATHEKSDLAG